MKLALWQSPPANGRIDEVFSAICQQLRAAAAAGAKLLVAPELILPGYNRPDLHPRAILDADNPMLSKGSRVQFPHGPATVMR